jgi:lipopolysaccharide/colanic/teichoic acid biosynthesis glycosyltransferase
MGKRCFDLALASLGLLCLAPLFLGLALLIKWDSPGPVFFRQERVGRGGKTFRIHKFRTMFVQGESGPQLTVGADRRITRVGGWLRRYKLDELAQLLDVIHGDMSLVGPRPEVPRYVALYPPEMRTIVLSVKPGITDRASIEFVDESTVLAQAADPHDAYVTQVLPAKLAHYARYAREHTLGGDIRILLATCAALVRKPSR